MEAISQREATGDVALHRAVRLLLEEELADLAKALPGLSQAPPEQLTVNGAGAFDVGGPEGDNGLSGKKLVMDAYGPRVPIGGGAWSGKDFFKADRAGGLHARRLAKLIVELGLASEATVTLGWYPGDREARVVDVATADGGTVHGSKIAKLVDLTLATSGNRLGKDLDLIDIARWGHFADPGLPWEGFGRV